METTQEIAKILRSTEKMASEFSRSIRRKIDEDVSDDVLLGALRKVNPRALDIDKVTIAVKSELAKNHRRETRRSGPARTIGADAAEPSDPKTTRAEIAEEETARPARRSIAQQLDELLESNWNRAEGEGLNPQRMSGRQFVDAVHRHSDRRDATLRRVLQACRRIDSDDVLLTPTVVADAIRQEV
jgi:hypothetical protein